jgi:hypothetical protein
VSRGRVEVNAAPQISATPVFSAGFFVRSKNEDEDDLPFLRLPARRGLRRHPRNLTRPPAPKNCGRSTDQPIGLASTDPLVRCLTGTGKV